MNKLFSIVRWRKLLSTIAAAFYSFWHDVVVTNEELEYIRTTGQITEQLHYLISCYHGYPHGRKFWIKQRVASDESFVWTASNGKSTYWLNLSAKRWVCVSGPDLLRDVTPPPKNVLLGNVKRDFVVGDDGWFTFYDKEK